MIENKYTYMAKPKRPGGPKQKLSPAAAKAKAERDLRYAKTKDRKDKKAHAQRERNKAGSKANGKDWDHKDGKWKSAKANRGNDGNGTKKEGKRNYRVPKNG